MIDIRPMTEASFTDGLRAWNEGFEGYPYAAAMSMSGWLAHITHEGLQPELSVIAYDGAMPVGCVMNGMRTVGDLKVAYNGGTGIRKDRRGQGIGRMLIDTSLAVYREHGADIATLEVVTTNDPALALYRRAGYEVTDRLSVMSCSDSVERTSHNPYDVVEKDPQAVEGLPCYRKDAPWQCQWQSVQDGRALCALGEGGETVGFALIRRSWSANTPEPVVGLFQAGCSPHFERPEAMVRALLEYAFQGAGRKYALNIPASDATTLSVLRGMGFTEDVAQFQMQCRPMRNA